MPIKKNIPEQRAVHEIWRHRGKVALAAQALGISYVTLYEMAKKYESVRMAIDDSRKNWDELLIDTAEMKLFKSILDDKSWAIKYALDTKGKHRGYTKEIGVTGGNRGPLEIALSWEITEQELEDRELAAADIPHALETTAEEGDYHVLEGSVADGSG